MKHKALTALLLATAIWGIAGPVIKFTLGYLPPLTFLTLRMFLASLVVLPFFIRNRGMAAIRKEGLKKMVFLSLLAQPLCLSLVFFGYRYTSSLEGTIIGATFPIFLALAGAIFLKETVTKKEQIGIAVTLMGTFLIIFIEPLLRNEPLALTNIKGNILVFLSNLVWIVYVILEKKRFGGRRKYHPEGMAFSFMVAFVVLVPLALLEMHLTKIDILAQLINAKALAGLLYMSLFSSVVAYLSYDFGLSKIEASETGVFSYLQPLFALPAAYLLLSEVPSVFMLPGLVFIGLGFWFCQKAANQQ
ncbi:MAG: DMT family transporter [bacterium]